MRPSMWAASLFAVLLTLTEAAAVRADSPPAVPDAALDLLQAVADLGATLSFAVIEELSKAGEHLAKEHFEADVWRGPAIEPDEYVGGFNFKLYPKGKSHSPEHFQAQTWYRLDRHGLKELEISGARQ